MGFAVPPEVDLLPMFGTAPALLGPGTEKSLGAASSSAKSASLRLTQPNHQPVFK